MINVDEKVVCRLTAGGNLKLDAGDRVLSDPTCGQWENGWWLVDENQVDYFLSEEGILYAEGDSDWKRAYQHAIGYHVPSVRRSRNFDRMIEAMADGFKCGTKVCTCQMVSHKSCPVHG